MRDAPAPAPGGSGALLVIVGLAGAGTMVVELSAVRLLAPWFGASAGVWTNVIGVVLLALALGYLLGARLAACREPERILGWALLLAAATSAWLPAGAGPVARFFLPQEVTLDRAAALLTWGSLAASLALFLPSALLLGCVGPLAVEVVQVRSGLHAGTAGGRVLCASTLGSLAGTFGTTHLLLPHLGLRHTFALAGAVLACLGLAVFLWTRQVAILPLLLAAVPLSAPFTGRMARPATPEGWRELARAESPYQSLRVVESTGAGPPLRMLQVNESFDSFQSVWQPAPGLLPPGYYYNAFVLPPWWSHAQGTWRLLVLGLGAGTAWRVLEGALPPGARLEAEGVEIDETLVRLARAHMDLAVDGDARRVYAGWDARAALALLPEGAYDEIVLDAYANQTEIPAHLASRAFFEQVRAHLRPGGWLVVNVGGFGFEDPVVEAIGCTVATAFAPHAALLFAVPFSRNVAVFARRDADVPTPGTGDWAVDGAPEIAGLLAPLELEGAWQAVRGGCGPVLEDDATAIEALERASLRRAARGVEGP